VLIARSPPASPTSFNTPLARSCFAASSSAAAQGADGEQLADLQMIDRRPSGAGDHRLAASFSRRSEGAMSETDMRSLIDESLSIIGKDLELKGSTSNRVTPTERARSAWTPTRSSRCC